MALVKSEKIETNKVKLEISVDKETFQKAVSAAYKKNVKNINVPGFRKGKAPRNIVEKMYGEAVFYEDAVDATYPQAYTEAVKEVELDVVDQPTVDIKEISGDGYSFTAEVFTKPEVTVKKYKGIKADKIIDEAKDSEVDAEIERLRERNSRIVTITDRPAEDGDITVIDFSGSVDGVVFEGGTAEKFELTVGSGQFIPGFEEQVVGKDVGSEFDVKVTFPEEYQAENLAGKEAVFAVKLHEIKTKVKPDLDDEFVKDVSEFDTLDELKADTKAKLQEKKDSAASEALENTLVDKVIESMEGEIPECMYERRIDDMVRDFEYRIQSQGLDINGYLQYTGMEMDSFRKTFREQSEKQVKIRLALEKIADLEKLEADESDITAEYEKMAEKYQLEMDKVRDYVPVTEITKDLVVNKAIDLVRDSAVVTEKKADSDKKKNKAK